MDKNMRLEDLGFSVRTWRCLKNAGVSTLEDLLARTPSDLLEFPSMGNKSIKEISDKLHEHGLEFKGFEGFEANPVVKERLKRLDDRQYWAEIRNDFFESGADIRAEDGDVLARISIDAWKTLDDNEEGSVIACVMLSKNGDVLVDYRDGVARIDEAAQEAVREAMGELREYFLELQKNLEDLNDMKNEKILYFGEGHFVTREALQEMAFSAAEDFLAKLNQNPNWRHDGELGFTYDFGSPYDELDVYLERDEDTGNWMTVCAIYTKGEGSDLTAVQSLELTTDVNDIATNILELVEELDCQIEINFVETMKWKMEELDKELSVAEKLDDANSRVAQENAIEGKGVSREDVKE